MFVCSCASMISDEAYTHHSGNLWPCVSLLVSHRVLVRLHCTAHTQSHWSERGSHFKPNGVYPREKSNRVCQCMGNACTYKCAGALHICVPEYTHAQPGSSCYEQRNSTSSGNRGIEGPCNFEGRLTRQARRPRTHAMSSMIKRHLHVPGEGSPGWLMQRSLVRASDWGHQGLAIIGQIGRCCN